MHCPENLRRFFISAGWFLMLQLPLGALTLGAVQFEVSPAIYADARHFEQEVLYWLDWCDLADMVVFPEYTSAFTAAFISSDISLEGILNSSEQVRNYLDQFWGTQAANRGIWILAGTYLEEENGQLYNTALLYSPQGECVLTQRKCYLGDPEIRYGISPGSLEDVKGFTIEDINMALTICRDTYHKEWDNHFQAAALWIDIKANELPYSEEYYAGALPSRLPQSPIDYGLTVSLVGSMLDYTFQGLSLLHRDKDVLLKTANFTKGTYLLIPVEAKN